MSGVGNSFTRDMGYSVTEFLRILPRAAHDYCLSIVGFEVSITQPEAHQELKLTITPLPDRQLAMMRLPHVQVHFEFMGFDEAQREQFMNNFDKSYHRGGG